MEKITYYYSALSKQVFILLLGCLVLFRFLLLMEVILYNINGYGELMNLGASIVLYGFYLAVCLLAFTGYKFFYTEFDEQEVIYHNRLLRKQKRVELTEIRRAHLTKRGIYLYGDGERKPLLYLPFFRWGVVSAVGVDRLYKLLKERSIEIQKDFKVLPGHGKRWKWVAILYSCMALLILGSATQTLSLVVAIFKSR
ncbi:hypothetical protein Ami103574_06120 [Aminipila butyrica]|uniref:Uncharacterized protein n=1 Tax=Aminipila butyrica TaxID=433296 RepID=A0A858BSP7_9FIRM|nr:hypothetical protein [Aminipila butyrica]QIB68923.1 hypothetical protein Ami103574_06120 [Aminipila butyrica]